MTHGTAIPDIMQLGYTKREAGFLFLVCRVSGYFTRAQFSTFADRGSGGVEQQLIDKAMELDHLRIIECRQNRHIYHVTSRALYRAVSQEDSTSRRLKGDEEMRRRLLILECCIRHPTSTILYSADEKQQYFTEQLGLPGHVLPWLAGITEDTEAHRTLGDPLRRLPILVAAQKSNRAPLRFLFVDPGFATARPFHRYLGLFAPLFRALGAFTLLYVGIRQSSLLPVRATFQKKLAGGFAGYWPELFPCGVGHFLSFLEAERRWTTSSRDLSTADVHLVNEGERMYLAGLHTELRQANLKGNDFLMKELARLGVSTELKAKFESHIVDLPRALSRSRQGPGIGDSQLELPLGA